MKTPAPRLVHLRLLRRLLNRQLRLLNNDYLDEALDVADAAEGVVERLEDLDRHSVEPPAYSVPAIARVIQECKELNDLIRPHLDLEMQLLSSEHFETQVDRELLRMRRTSEVA